MKKIVLSVSEKLIKYLYILSWYDKIEMEMRVHIFIKNEMASSVLVRSAIDVWKVS